MNPRHHKWSLNFRCRYLKGRRQQTNFSFTKVISITLFWMDHEHLVSVDGLALSIDVQFCVITDIRGREQLMPLNYMFQILKIHYFSI